MVRFRKITGIFLAIAVAVSCCGCNNKRFKPKGKDTVVLTEKYTLSASSSRTPDKNFQQVYAKFSLGLFQQMRKEGAEFVSPYSVYAVLAIAMNGAGGQTLEEMKDVLGLPEAELNAYMKTLSDLYNKGEIVAVADSVWVNSPYRKSIKEDFLNIASGYYDADVISADFGSNETVKDMNNWVKAKTLGRISELIDKKELDNMTVMAVFNCLTFDGKWEKRFEKDATSDAPFTQDDGTSRTVKMMSGKAESYFETEEYIGIDKQYKEGYFFRAYLPKEGVTAEQLLNAMTAEQLINPGNYNGEAILKLPKITVKSAEMNMVSALQEIGIRKAFSEKEAEFPRLSTMECYLEKVCQKTFLEVDEEGTKAAAASKGLFKTKSEPLYHEVILNRSFIYGIYDAANGIPLFIGIYN